MDNFRPEAQLARDRWLCRNGKKERKRQEGGEVTRLLARSIIMLVINHFVRFATSGALACYRSCLAKQHEAGVLDNSLYWPAQDIHGVGFH